MSEIKQGYKQTKVGIIPEDWEVVSLNEGAVFLDHKRKPLKDEYRQKIQGQYPYYGASGIIDYVNDYIFDEELILIGEDGANIIDRNSRLVFLANGKYWVNNHAHVLKAKPNFNNYFLCEFLESLKYDKYNTGTAQPKLNKEIVSNIPIIKPPLKEQEKIAEILTTWDEAITKQTELLEAKELQKKALMQKLLSGEVRFSGFSDEWHFYKLGYLLDYEQPTNYLVNDTNYDDSFNTPVLTAGKTFILGYTNETDGIYKEQLPVIIFDDFTTATQFVNFPFKAKSSAMKILKSKGNLGNIKVIFELMQTIKYQADDHKRYWISEYQDLEIKLPSLPEQQKIAEVLSLADDEINLLKNELEELKLQKKALMQKLLTGQVRVKV